MADMLKFRKGTIEQISKADKVAGTIYIAKDEKAMYVDISASERIRIGDFVRVASINEIPKPYSETAIYYVETDNALLGYKDGKWSQINGTEALVTRISTAEGLIAANTKAIENNAKAIDEVETYVGTFSHNSAKTIVEYINAKTDGIATSGNLEALGNRVTVVEGKMTTAEGDIDTLEGIVAGHTSKITELETASAKHALKTDLDDYAKSSDVYTKTQVYTKSEADSAIETAKTAILGEANYNGTVKGVYEAAAAAKKAADDANDLAAGKTTAAEVKTQIEAYKYATETKAAELANAAKDAAIEDAKKYALQTSLDATNDIVSGHTAKLDTLTGSGSGSVAEAKKAGDDAANALTEYQNAHKDDYTNSQIDAAVAAAKKAGDDAQATANTANNQANANKAAIDKLNGSATTEGSVAKAIADAESRLTGEIANKINAANAMDYKGGVDSEDTLNEKTEVKAGDTYVATKKFTFTDGRAVYPGDLLIAEGEEVNGVIAVPAWEIVHTGYDATLEQEIKTAESKIVLLSAVGANNGEIAFVSDGSSAKVTVANNTITVGMEWEDFE